MLISSNALMFDDLQEKQNCSLPESRPALMPTQLPIQLLLSLCLNLMQLGHRPEYMTLYLCSAFHLHGMMCN